MSGNHMSGGKTFCARSAKSSLGNVGVPMEPHIVWTVDEPQYSIQSAEPPSGPTIR
jgi:hypothetical protein